MMIDFLTGVVEHLHPERAPMRPWTQLDPDAMDAELWYRRAVGHYNRALELQEQIEAKATRSAREGSQASVRFRAREDQSVELHLAFTCATIAAASPPKLAPVLFGEAVQTGWDLRDDVASATRLVDHRPQPARAPDFPPHAFEPTDGMPNLCCVCLRGPHDSVHTVPVH